MQCTLCKSSATADIRGTLICAGCGQVIRYMPSLETVEARNDNFMQRLDLKKMDRLYKEFFGIGSGNTDVGAKSDRAYHGGQFNAGEW